jgi:hypothetical protein
MNPQSLTGISIVDGIPSKSLLNGLTQLYELVIVLDADARIKWIHNRIESLPQFDDRLVGCDSRPYAAKSSEPGLEFAIR